VSNIQSRCNQLKLGHPRYDRETRQSPDKCKSENVRQLDGELTASSPEIRDVRVPPVSVCQPISVCLGCGFSELVFPACELDLLRRSSLK